MVMPAKSKLELAKLQPSDCILRAMQALEEGGTGIALVTDAAGHLRGTLTDGDIRRALLGGNALLDPVEPIMERNFIAVRPSAGRAEVLDLMHARKITQIPILDGDGRLIGLHRLHEVVRGSSRPNWGVLMAGGQGMRLRPLTETIPKPMIPVAGRPILERLVLHMVGIGITRIYLAVNHLGHVIESHFGQGEAFGCEIRYLREAEPLGTAGALTLLPEKPTQPVLVMNGDLVTQADLGSMLNFHDEHRYDISLGVHLYAHTVPFGCVDVDGHQVVHIEEKPRLTKLINAGIYVINPDMLDMLPAAQPATMPGLIAQSLDRGARIGAFEIADDWIDVGQFDQLKQARQGEC
jgi:dTDP-glucose pyrophosphorylase